MEQSTELKIFKRYPKKKKQEHEIIFGLEYYINTNLKIKCGFSIINDFKPMLWIQQYNNNYIGLERDEWIHLMAYKEYIQLKLDHHNFLAPDTVLDHPTLQKIICDFKYKKCDGSCVLILKQNGNAIEIDSETWKSILRIGIFLSTFLCWNTILQKQIYNFYHSHFIPKCVELKKTDIQLSEIDGIYGEDVRIDLTRLCFEITKKMQREIKKDVKMQKLLIRTKLTNPQ